MTQLAVLLSTGLLLVTLVRRDNRPPVRGTVYWWTWSNFGLQLLPLVLAAAGLVSDTDEAVGFAFTVPAVALSLLLATRAALAGGTVSLPALLCAAPVVVGLGYVLGGDSLITPLLWLGMFAAVAVQPPGGLRLDQVEAGLVASLRVVAAAVMLAAIVLPGTFIGPCRLDKCSVWGDQIGDAGATNGLGMGLALLCVVVAARMPWWRSVAVLLAGAALIDLCASRSALAVLAVGGAAIVIERRARRGTVRTLFRAGLCVLTAAATTFVAVYPWQHADLTDRGSLWIAARDLVAERPLLGWGSSHWVRQGDTVDLVPNYSTHNLLLELLVGFGVLGTAAVLVSVVLVRRAVPSGWSDMWHVHLFAWLGGGITEVLAAPGRYYLLPGALILVFVAVVPSSRPLTRSYRRPAFADVRP